jgi:predicted nucleic acid-binding protein
MRENEISAAELDELRDGFYQDLQRRRFWLRRLREFHYHAAVRLVRRYAPERLHPWPRALDAVHLAVALDVREREGLDLFVSADKDLYKLAEAEQLRVLNPENP